MKQTVQESKTKSLIGKADEFLIMVYVENVMLFDSYILFCQKSFSEKIDNSSLSHLCFMRRWVTANQHTAQPPQQTIQSETEEGVAVAINVHGVNCQDARHREGIPQDFETAACLRQSGGWFNRNKPFVDRCIAMQYNAKKRIITE